MTMLRQGPVAAALLGACWMVTLAITVAVAVAFVTGEALRPSLLWSVLLGAAIGAALLFVRVAAGVVIAGLFLFGGGTIDFEFVKNPAACRDHYNWDGEYK